MSQSLLKFDIRQDVRELIANSGINIEDLRGKRVLITGGTGFFGVWMLSALIDIKSMLDGELEIFLLSRDPESFVKAFPASSFVDHVSFFQGDVKDFQLTVSGITHIAHMATTSAGETFAGEAQINKLEMLSLGTKNLLSQCDDSLESVLFTSSGVVYGAANDGPIDETVPTAVDSTNPGSALGLGKLIAEYLVQNNSKAMDYKFTVARCFSFAGPYLPTNLHYAFGNFIQDALTGRKITVRGDGLDKRSFMYIGDSTAWLLRMLVQPMNRVYNVGSERSTKVLELAQMVSTLAGRGHDIEVLGKECEVGNFRRSCYIPSTLRARSDYPGLAEWTSLEETILRMTRKN
jgi:dTDP-glucose 4,6-dehydratase/UDP-glucose 4-epimerase